jgi:ferritin-like metal-binding protein YciE
MDTFEQTKEEIQEIVSRAEEVVAPKIEPIKQIIEEIKAALVHGTDTIPTSRVQDWALALSLYNADLSPHKEAFSLASMLWRVDINNSNAKTLADRRAEQKKAEIENQNVIDSKDKETQKIIVDYMSGMIKSTQENIYQMCSELNRILDARNWNREAK